MAELPRYDAPAARRKTTAGALMRSGRARAGVAAGPPPARR